MEPMKIDKFLYIFMKQNGVFYGYRRNSMV